MFFQQFYDQKLAQTSYMVGCQKTGEAIIIDPKRVLDDYALVADREGLSITHATETHIHADFASGLRDAARHFGAKLFVSDEGDEDWKYENVPADTVFLKEGHSIHVGNVELKVIHTPGHTPESISFVLYDHGGGSEEPMGIFTGDFLFVGDIGRPDLLEEAAKMEGTTEIGAKQMYESIQKLVDYPDFMQVWPGHGAGSACGKSLGAIPLSTLGYERHNNWAFRLTDQDAFIKELTTDQPEPPTYFAQMKKVNKLGLPPFSVKEITVGVPAAIKGQLIDLRTKEDFAKGFKQGSINVPYNDKFVQFVGWFIRYDEDLTVIANPKHSEMIQEDLASIGFDRLVQIIPIDEANILFDSHYDSVTAEQLLDGVANKHVLDVRTTAEYKEGHLDEAVHIHYGHLLSSDIPFAKNAEIFVHCQSGVRSAMAMGILRNLGYENVVNVTAGYNGIRAASIQ